jgi:hypothetical protein
MAFDKDEVRDVLLSKGFGLVEEKTNSEVRFWFLFSTPTRLNHLAILSRTQKRSRNLVVYLQDHEMRAVVTDLQPFSPGRMASTEFPRMADFELFLDIVKRDVYVPRQHKAVSFAGVN